MKNKIVNFKPKDELQKEKDAKFLEENPEYWYDVFNDLYKEIKDTHNALGLKTKIF